MSTTAIVTGGTGGLGAATVARLLEDGWRVVDEVAAVAAGHAKAPLAGLVNLVGGFHVGGRVHETPPEEFEEQFRLNLRPTYLMTRAVLPYMLDRRAGSIVCVGTRAAVQPFPGAAGYVSSKAAVIAFAHAVAVEYKNDGIRCNVILPSVIDTPANRASMPDAKHERWVKPAEIAGVLAHLLSADSGPTSGAAIPVYGRA
jgi:NAD(P)-dependent dehydrogenase (short-subunit alcohol dehydrogenase family)